MAIKCFIAQNSFFFYFMVGSRYMKIITSELLTCEGAHGITSVSLGSVFGSNNYFNDTKYTECIMNFSMNVSIRLFFFSTEI